MQRIMFQSTPERTQAFQKHLRIDKMLSRVDRSYKKKIRVKKVEMSSLLDDLLPYSEFLFRHGLTMSRESLEQICIRITVDPSKINKNSPLIQHGITDIAIASYPGEIQRSILTFNPDFCINLVEYVTNLTTPGSIIEKLLGLLTDPHSLKLGN